MDCSQLSQRAHLDLPGTSGGPDEYTAPRKLVRRMPSPPCARNVFVDGPEDEATDASRMTKRPPFVSRYRCELNAPLKRGKHVWNTLGTCNLRCYICIVRTSWRPS